MTGWRGTLGDELAVDVEHLDRALGLELRHRVYAEALLDPRGPLFQRLEYVGDSILDAVVLRSLVRLQPWSEPDLSVINGQQQAMVSDQALGRLAAGRGFPDVRAFDASRHRLADRIEASIGAAWADSGIAAAEDVATRLVVGPGLRHASLLDEPPDADGDDRYEAASTICGHVPLTVSWYGAAAAGGAPRRRLAAVGDAVLEAACATAQYVEAPLATEAMMSEERRDATSNAALARRAHDLGLVRRADPPDRRALADEVQALVGAATMDGGTAAGLAVAAGALGRTHAPDRSTHGTASLRS